MIDHYNEFRDYLEQACGIMLGDNKQYLVSSRVGRIMLEHDIKNLNELVGRLRREPLSPLRQIIIDAMTTNETLWFRDVHPYTILKDKLLPELQKTPGMHKVRIWSAACSSGQEPYSISMTVEEYKRAAMGVLKAPVEIVATDLSRSILQSAQDGIYDGLSVARGLSAERLRLYFDKQGDRWQIKPFVKQRVRFQSLNLLDHYGVLGKFDIVFCRNVLIYFSAQLKTDILRRIHATLKPGGYLLVGASEGLNNLSDIYEMVQCSPGIIYRAK